MTKLLEETTEKITDNINRNNNLKNEIIYHTNNYREFKSLKKDILNQFSSYEKDFKQIILIIKSLTDQSLLFKNQIENLESEIKESAEEKNNYLGEIENLKIKNEAQITENDEKDIFIHDLLTKINFLENVVADYQRRIYIPKFDKLFSYKSPLKKDDPLRKFYDKFFPKDYNYPLFFLNSNKNFQLGKKLEENLKFDKMRKENVKHLIKNRPKSSNRLISEIKENSPIIPNEDKKFTKIKKNTDYNTNKVYESTEFNLNNNNHPHNILNNINNNEVIEREDTDFILNNNFINENRSNKKQINSKLEKDKENNDNYDLKTNSINLDTEEAFKKDKVNTIELKSNQNSKENFYLNKKNIKEENNKVNFESKENFHSSKNLKKISQEKEKANIISNLLLKIFSKSNISKILQKKFGENFEIKITDKEVDLNFLKIIEEEVDEHLKKEKEFLTKEKMEEIKLKKNSDRTLLNLRNISPSEILLRNSFSPMENRKAFNNFTKNQSEYFDPKFIYGGESRVSYSTRARSNERLGLERTSFSPKDKFPRESNSKRN